ncbi:hypothetical protein C8J57DRAFT_1295817 [Mycena rebaudengoi]|nr:hypothetical protein C8J57DRAFT_1295817 [Mycena rebaudengoi]
MAHYFSFYVVRISSVFSMLMIFIPDSCAYPHRDAHQVQGPLVSSARKITSTSSLLALARPRTNCCSHILSSNRRPHCQACFWTFLHGLMVFISWNLEMARQHRGAAL